MITCRRYFFIRIKERFLINDFFCTSTRYRDSYPIFFLRICQKTDRNYNTNGDYCHCNPKCWSFITQYRLHSFFHPYFSKSQRTGFYYFNSTSATTAPNSLKNSCTSANEPYVNSSYIIKLPPAETAPFSPTVNETATGKAFSNV